MSDLKRLVELTAEAKAIGADLNGLVERAARLWAEQPEMGNRLIEFFETRVADLRALTRKVN